MAFFSAGSAQSREHAPLAVRAGALVVDKSSAFRMDPAVPLVVPEINPHAAQAHRGIVASPNCTTVVTVMPLAPLHRAAGVRRVVATSYQAVSGAGVNGVEDLRQHQQWLAHHPFQRQSLVAVKLRQAVTPAQPGARRAELEPLRSALRLPGSAADE